MRYGHRSRDSATLSEMYRRSRDEGFGPEVKRRIMLGTYALSAGYYDAYYLKAQKVRTLLTRDFEQAFAKVDAIITPTSPTPAFKLGEKVDDPLSMYLADIFTVTADLVGVPGISIPCGQTDEILISCHACHPSLANDNLSGLAVATFLAKLLSQSDRRYSYRFLFIPGTIGAITWLAQNRETAGLIRHGLVLTCIGDSRGFHYKKSRRGNAEIDRAVSHVLKHQSEPSEILDFSPYGYDERQYCSPGFNLPVGCLMRSVWGTFPEYHTSADNLEFIHAEQLADSLRVCTAILDVLENNRKYRNLSPYCEPQLGRRNLYRAKGGGVIAENINALLWVLNFSDGEHSLLDIAERSGVRFSMISEAARLLQDDGLLAIA